MATFISRVIQPSLSNISCSGRKDPFLQHWLHSACISVRQSIRIYQAVKFCPVTEAWSGPWHRTYSILTFEKQIHWFHHTSNFPASFHFSGASQQASAESFPKYIIQSKSVPYNARCLDSGTGVQPSPTMRAAECLSKSLSSHVWIRSHHSVGQEWWHLSSVWFQYNRTKEASCHIRGAASPLQTLVIIIGIAVAIKE